MRNRVRCKKCMDVIESKHRHDFVTCSCGSVFVDGGKDYYRIGGELKNIERVDDDGNPHPINE